MKDATSSAAGDALRDIAAAKAEIQGRRDHVVADFDERMQQLANVAAAVESGELNAKVAQDRVRQLLGDRAGALRSTRAGRTRVGMRLPATAEQAPTGLRTGLTPVMTGAAVTKVIGEVDSRIMRLITRATDAATHEEIRLELALLGQMRRTLERQAAAMPEDSVLLASVLEYAEEARSALSDLDTGGGERLKRLLEYDRMLLSQLVALGGAVTGIKEQIQRARALLSGTDPTLEQALQDAVGVFARLQRELDRRLPGERTLLDRFVSA